MLWVQVMRVMLVCSVSALRCLTLSDVTFFERSVFQFRTLVFAEHNCPKPHLIDPLHG